VRRNTAIVVTVIACILVVSGVTVSLFFGSNLFSGKAFRPTERFTLIIADSGPNKGINGSYYIQSKNPHTPSPVFYVKQGDLVAIQFINSNLSKEPHALGIEHYYTKYAILQPGQSVTINFFANVAGNFTVYDALFSAIQPYAENGLMIVSS
jgi:hypothetical protein